MTLTFQECLETYLNFSRKFLSKNVLAEAHNDFYISFGNKKSDGYLRFAFVRFFF